MRTRHLTVAVWALLLIAFGEAFSLSDRDFSEEASVWAKKTLAGLSLEKKIGRMVRAYVRGYHDQGMLTTAKHFPGRGDVEAMPGKPGWSWINKSAADVETQEFRAFKHAIDAGVDFVMSEHIAVPSVTEGSDLPASVEKKLAAGWLREKLGFKGILTTDDLWYDNVVQRFGTEEVAVKAFKVGHDIILKPKDPGATIAVLAAAVKSGRLTERRVDEAALKGELKPSGRLPVRVSDEYPIGSGLSY